MVSDDHKMVSSEFDGVALTGSSSALAVGLGEDNGEVDEDPRTTAKLHGYSMDDGVAWVLGFVFPCSDEMPMRTKSMARAPTTKIEQGLSFEILGLG